MKLHAENELRGLIAEVGATPSRLQALLDEAAVRVVAFDLHRTIVATNAGGSRHFGYEPHELEGQSVDVLVPVRLRQPGAPAPAVTDDLTTVELPALCKDGSEVATVWIFGAARIDGGSIFLMALLDRTEASSVRLTTHPHVSGGGIMGDLIRTKSDWKQTKLGEPSTWPQSLRTALSIALSSRFPMIIFWGEELSVLYNDAYIPIFGAKHPEVLGKTGFEAWGEVWDVIFPMFQRVRGGEATWSEDQLLALHRRGFTEETYLTWSYSPIADESGDVGGVFTAVQETTARVLSERRLATLRELGEQVAEAKTIESACKASMATLAKNAHDVPFAAIYVADGAGWRRAESLQVNGVMPTVVEGPEPWHIAEVATQRHSMLVERDDVALPGGPWPEPAHRAFVVPIAKPGQSATHGVLVAGISPRLAFDDAYSSFFELAGQHIASAISNAVAYEEERRRAEALAEIDRAKTAFFSNVSHEFRTPLTLMLGPLEDALGSAACALDGESLRTVHRNALRLLKLVNALLDFSRIEAGRAVAAYRPTDLAALTKDLASAFRAAIERAGLAFEVDCPPLPEPIFVDHDMWEKVVLNLISNALKFTFEGKIAVRLVWTDQGAELSVEDTGVGIPERELGRLFERFHRIQGARARTHEGSGIGLSLVNELVRLHGGTIRVQSREGVGTTFRLLIPRGTAHLAPERVHVGGRDTRTIATEQFVQEALRWLPAVPGEPQAVPSERLELLLTPEAFSRHVDGYILLADDNADMRDYLLRLLRQRWTVEAVNDGTAALASAKRRQPDLVITDVMMPGLDGFGLLQALRATPETQTTPVIMLSARAGEESRVEGLQAGADDYLVKPFSARELIARVATQLQLSAHRKKEQALRTAAEQASRAKDEFLGILSHELRTPLNAIVGWSTLLRQGSVRAEQLNKALDTIERNARALTRLIEDLLDLSRLEQGKLALTVGPLEMVRVVEAAIDTVRPAADAKGVRIQIVLDSHATIVGDADRLQQVVWNLMTNAVKFTPRGGRVQVSLRRQSSYVELVVSDTGQGIDASFIPHVFDRFRQADPSSSRKAGGLGLGLAIARSIVELHGGTVSVASEGRDLGATFTVKLPTAPLRASSFEADMVAETDAPRPMIFDCPPELAGVKVLVVDDEPETRGLLEYVISECQARVTTAASAAEAYELLQREHFDVLLSDVGMPEEDGHSLLRKIRALPHAIGRLIPAIALTAYARSEDRAEAFRAGFDMHMSKPIDPNELILAMVRLVAREAK